MELNEKDLTDMGITLFGPRKKLMNVIKQYKERGVITVEPDLASGNVESNNGDLADKNNVVEKRTPLLKAWTLYSITLVFRLSPTPVQMPLHHRMN